METLSKTFTIGDTLEVNRIGLGTMRATTGAGSWGEPADRQAVIKLIRKAYELGVNFFDTADAYGPGCSELILAEAIEPFKKQVIVGTKGGSVKYAPGKMFASGKPGYLKTTVEASLRRLNIETIDLYQLDHVDPEVPIEESVWMLACLKKQGKIREIGLSNIKPDQLRLAQGITRIASVQNSLSIANQTHLKLAQICATDNIAFIAYCPTGMFDGEKSATYQQKASEMGITLPQLSLFWLLKKSPNIIPIPGTSSEKHLQENLAVWEMIPSFMNQATLK
ncbi:aldo/keto reductase [Emticicia sp. 17c]|uniref:aldo/keto reductase n=1 Tax=Emticicia sp. 17c TaxID=3127704 RepID=UPI00301D4055